MGKKDKGKFEVSIDLSEWEDPYALLSGEEALESAIKVLKVFQKNFSPIWGNSDETDQITWLEDILYLVRQVNKQLKKRKNEYEDFLKKQRQ